MANKYELLATFEAVRLRAHNFCSFRNWEKFHLPTSLTLALSGECGEVCEIFQWKGSLESDLQANDDVTKVLSEKEIIHIGEEIADVCIYTTRLCDVCNINLGNAVLERLQSFQPQINLPISFTAPRPWPSSITLDQVSSFLSSRAKQYRSQRTISLELQSEVGGLCSVFSKYSDAQSLPGLPHWPQQDVHLITQHAASIIILMICLAKICNLSIDKCITDKFYKNDAKYPVSLSKGSSAKYTAYVGTLTNKKQQLITVAWIGLAVACFVAGRYSQAQIMRGWSSRFL